MRQRERVAAVITLGLGVGATSAMSSGGYAIPYEGSPRALVGSACDPVWLPVTRPDSAAYFVARTAEPFGPGVRAEIVAGNAGLRDDGAVIPAGPAVLVPWAYTLDCSPLPWGGEPWKPPEAPAFYTGVLRDAKGWIQGMPTIDIFMAWREPMWRTNDPRWGAVDPEESLLTPEEFQVLYAALPTESALRSSPDSLVRALRAWVAAHGDIAEREPAATILANLFRRLERPAFLDYRTIQPPAATWADTLLDVNGTRLFVRREGAGPPAIVVHGGPVLDHGYLARHLAPLSRDLELLYYDQRLSGRSAGVVDSASVRLDTFVADIGALADALGLERFHLIGHSWGGLLAMGYAIAHPERLRSLILLSPLPPTTAGWQAEEEALAASITASDTAGSGALRSTPGFAAREPAAVEAVLRHSFRSVFHDPALAANLDFYITGDYAERSRQFGFLLPDLMSFDLTEGLGSVRVPTLVLYGADEPGARIGGEAIVAAMPDATLVTIPESGHFPFMERPEAFVTEVRSFVHTRARAP